MAVLTYIALVLIHSFVKGPFALTTHLSVNHTEGMDISTRGYFDPEDRNVNKSIVSDKDELAFPNLKNESSNEVEHEKENSTGKPETSTDVIPTSDTILRNESARKVEDNTSQDYPDGTVNEDLNRTSTSAIRKNICKHHGTCDAIKEVEIPNCYCDDACRIFKDCCFDAPQPQVNDYTEALHDVAKKASFAKCETLQFGTDEELRIAGSYIISTCPIEYPVAEVTHKCQFGDTFPVNTPDGLTYKNVYCFYCHGNTDYEVWRFECVYDKYCTFESIDALEFTGSIAKINHIKNTGCKYYFRPPVSKIVRYCWLYEDVEINDEIRKSMCEKFVNPVYEVSEQKARRNIHCATRFDKIRCLHSTFSGIRFQLSKLELSGIFNIRPVIEVAGEKICKSDEVYNKDSHSCILKQCTDSEDTMCEPELIKNFVWETDKLSFVTDSLTEKDMVMRVIVFFYSSLPREKYNMAFLGVVGSFACDRRSGFGRPCCMFKGTTYFALQKEMSLESIEKFKTQAQDMSWSYTEIRQNLTIAAVPFDQQMNTSDSCEVEPPVSNVGGNNGHFQRIKQLFVFDDRNRSKSKMPSYIKGVAVTKKTKGMKDDMVQIQDWMFQYTTSSGVTHASELSPLTLICWLITAILLYCFK